MVNCYDAEEYVKTKNRLHKELYRLRDYYKVPNNEPKDLIGKGLHYHSNHHLV